MSLRDQEQAQQVEAITQAKKKLKGHKQMLRAEVIRQREQIQELQSVASHKTSALASLSDFFKNQTLAQVRQIQSQEELIDVSDMNDGNSSYASKSEKSHKSHTSSK